MDLKNFNWTRFPESFTLLTEGIEVVTKPHTDLWGKIPIIIFKTTMPLFSKWKPKKNTSVLL